MNFTATNRDYSHPPTPSPHPTPHSLAPNFPPQLKPRIRCCGLNLTSSRPRDTPWKVPVQPARNLGGELGQGVQPSGCPGARWGHQLHLQTPQFSLASLDLGGGYLRGRSGEEGGWGGGAAGVRAVQGAGRRAGAAAAAASAAASPAATQTPGAAEAVSRSARPPLPSPELSGVRGAAGRGTGMWGDGGAGSCGGDGRTRGAAGARVGTKSAQSWGPVPTALPRFGSPSQCLRGKRKQNPRP